VGRRVKVRRIQNRYFNRKNPLFGPMVLGGFIKKGGFVTGWRK
jgi:hypothetical protein